MTKQSQGARAAGTTSVPAATRNSRPPRQRSLASRALRRSLSFIRRYPTVAASASIVIALTGLALYAVIAIPLSEAVYLWRGADQVWSDTPRNARPAWTNLFRSTKLPETFVIRMDDASGTVERLGESMWRETTLLTFDYKFSTFPNEINFFFDATFEAREPQATLTWVTPNGEKIRLFRGNVRSGQRCAISQDRDLRRILGEFGHVGLLANPETIGQEDVDPEVRKGEYTLRVETLTFEKGSTVGGRLVVYGDVYGIAGTDHLRRDLAIGLLWGTPIALMFGLLATIGTTVLGFVIAAFGTWCGGWIDGLVQRITEVNLMLPFLPILIMVGTFYSRSIWVMLVVIIALSIFSAALRSYRAMFLQAKGAAYIEAARAYGASNSRIIFRYLIPRILPVLVPNFVIGIPQFVFLEASLSILGLGDPTLPTWGKILTNAYQAGALYRGYYYWVLEPTVLLMITGLSFSMLGFALDRIFNPRLRSL